MKGYVKPEIIANEDLSEGIFMASGAVAGTSTDCWTVSGRSVQNWNGSHNVFEMKAIHSKGVVHITSKVDFVYTFSGPIADAYSEGGNEVSVNGNTVNVTRNLHANGYNSGDVVTFKVWVKSFDEASTKALSLTDASYTCRHDTNVQGGID